MQKLPETLAEQQKAEQIAATYLDEPTAWRAAEKIESDVNRWSALRNERQNLPGFRNAFKRVRLRDYEGMTKRSIKSGIENVESQISSIEQRQSSYLSRRFYNYVKERAVSHGMNRLGEELEYELEHTPHEVYDRMKSDAGWWENGVRNPALNQERRLYNVIVGAANLLASPKDKGKITYQLSSGSGEHAHNPLVRATLGFGAQGESHADLSDATKLSSLIGVNDHSRIPKTLPELGHFSLGMSAVASFAGDRPQMPEYEDEDFQLNFRFKYEPESRRPSGEDITYDPDSLEVIVSKKPTQRSHGGKGLPVAAGELAAAKS